MSETKLVKSILEQVNYYGFFWRNNTGARSIISQTGTRFFRFGLVGSADIIGIVKGRFVAIEAKSMRGIQSDAQKHFEHEITRHGGIYILARQPEDALNAIRGLYENNNINIGINTGKLQGKN